MSLAAPARRMYRENDPDMPEELHHLLVQMLSHHLENSANPYYNDLIIYLWDRCMRLPTDDQVKVALARLMQQEVEHGAITARLLEGLGAPPVNEPIQQYAFRIPLDTFCDLAYFHGLCDRVGVYIGETWETVPYEPMAKVAPKLHKDEVFHSTLGMRNLRLVCSTPEGRAEANEKIKRWWPAALDMFGRSDSTSSDAYVEWGLRQKNNAELRRQYIADTRPLLDELGIDVPEDRLNRRFL
jgi:ring-1,2-phenylacetyl-CoA epoxidase subunit PaaA